MWKFRIACFASICAVVWAVSLFTQFQTSKNRLAFLPVLGVLGFVHTVGITQFAEKSGRFFRRAWVGCVCGALDATLTLLLLLLATSVIGLGEKGSVHKLLAAVALCAPFVLSPLLSPRIVAAFVKEHPDETPGSLSAP